MLILIINRAFRLKFLSFWLGRPKTPTWQDYIVHLTIQTLTNSHWRDDIGAPFRIICFAISTKHCGVHALSFWSLVISIRQLSCELTNALSKWVLLLFFAPKLIEKSLDLNQTLTLMVNKLSFGPSISAGNGKKLRRKRTLGLGPWATVFSGVAGLINEVIIAFLKDTTSQNRSKKKRILKYDSDAAGWYATLQPLLMRTVS